MKTVYRSLVIALPIILMAAFCCYGAKGDEDFDPNQDVKKLGRNRAKNTLDIRFILGADPHFNANRYYGKWRWDKNQGNGIGPLRCVSSLINAKCREHKEKGEGDCIGVIIAGDLTRGDYWSHSQLFYRSIFEHDHSFGTDPFGEDWWDKWMPSDDDQIDYPVYPSCGNHDDESHNDRPEVRRYIEKRVKDSDALFTGKDASGKTISNYYHGIGDGVYAWEWGSIHFIQMGVWAFYGKYEKHGTKGTYANVDWDRVKWFQDHLEAVGKEKAIILIQHFDWNSKDDGDTPWWSSDNADMLLDVICDREVGGGSTQCNDPYNVVAMFTGHAHEWGYHEDLLQGQGPRKLPSYRCDDTGHDLNRSGFYDIRINFMDAQKNIDNKFIGEMSVRRKVLADGRYWGDKQKKKDKLETTYDTEYSYLFKTQEIFTEYLRFDQGEPNNGGDSGKEEDCAVIKANGRYNDENRHKTFPVLCWDKDAHEWHLTDHTDLEWKDGFHYCEDIHGYEFTEPKDIGQQIKAIKTLQEAGVESAWINYT
ncbi:MAG: hypothetical protein JRL30_20100, partial [Deltaproteobacteria bacterium]|nr:hypothetical protein [Deltaproteobacteria bacterium]